MATDPASHRIAIVCEGSRGDAQPYAALLLGLNKAGYTTKMLTNSSNVEMARSLGVDVEGTMYDQEALVRTVKHESDAPEAAFAAFTKARVKLTMERGHIDAKASWQALTEFKPTIICHSFCSRPIAHVWSAKHEIPVVELLLQNNLPTYSKPPVYTRNIPCNGNWIYYWLSMLGSFKMCGLFLSKITDAIGENAFDYASPVSMTYFPLWERAKFPGVSFYGLSKHVIEVMPEWPKDRVHHVGFWVADKSRQEETMRTSAAFGGEEHARLVQFLAAGEAPVYIGWGSMIAVSPEYMVRLAVGALQVSGKRGVLLGGWADLRTESLPAELRDYAAERVLTVRAAPHEWLFPQCSTIVHHGGAGTTAASCRSGRPTIITPVIMDQYEFARDVNRLGAGVGFKQFGLVTPEALAAAIKRCTEDAEVQEAARRLGEKLQAEDGVQKTVELLGQWLREEFASGSWLKRHRALMEEVKNPSPLPNVLAKPMLGFAILSLLLAYRRKSQGKNVAAILIGGLGTLVGLGALKK